ncbi:MAG: hypothetical protein HW403_994 [Dehalococcoidia bacterium]|nr:hypothetical protein [Dehalococcoidia bacterium]
MYLWNPLPTAGTVDADNPILGLYYYLLLSFFLYFPISYLIESSQLVYGIGVAPRLC